MLNASQTVEVICEPNGNLRPLAPLDLHIGDTYLVVVISPIKNHPINPSWPNWRGQYKKLLSSSAEFSQLKQREKELER